MFENIFVIAIRHAAGTKESAIDHVVDEDPGGGSARHIRSFPPEAEGPETQGL
jgi:hypothetical protein